MTIFNYNKTVSIFISVLVISIYFSYYTQILSKIPCEQEISSKILSNFIHTNSIHLILNLIGLHLVSELETKIGSLNFFTLVIFITIILSLFEYVLKNKCSIGISGVLYGLIAYQMFKFKNIDYNLIYILIFLFLFSNDSYISHTGHLLGFISGLLATYLL